MSIVEKLKDVFSNTPKSESISPGMEFIKSRTAILQELLLSKESGKLIGVYSPAFGEGMFLAKVDQIETDGLHKVIIFHKYDMSGIILLRTRIELSEIKMVCPFNVSFSNPVLEGYGNIKRPYSVFAW
jgi:hypothetical protein